MNELDADVQVLRKEVVHLRTSKAGTVSNAKRAAAKQLGPEEEPSQLEEPALFTKNQMRDLLVLKAGK